MWNIPSVEDGLVYGSVFAGNLAFLLSIVIGLFATYFVFRAAHKMGGGLFGKVLNYVGVGMTLVILGTISVTLDPVISLIWARLLHTIFFALGFIFLVIGAEKLLKGITQN